MSSKLASKTWSEGSSYDPHPTTKASLAESCIGPQFLFEEIDEILNVLRRSAFHHDLLALDDKLYRFAQVVSKPFKDDNADGRDHMRRGHDFHGKP